MRFHRRLDQLAILRLEKEIVSQLLDQICRSKVEFGIKDRSKVLDGTGASANYVWSSSPVGSEAVEAHRI
jgi:hypothetical protein